MIIKERIEQREGREYEKENLDIKKNIKNAKKYIIIIIHTI